MPSSILISRIRRNLFWLLVVSLLAYLAAGMFVVFVSPQSVEQRGVRRLKRDYALQLKEQYGNKVVFVGGSSTTYSVMPSVLAENYGIHAVNAGLNAGLGSGFLLCWGLLFCEPGDTLVVMIEPGLFRSPYSQPSSQSVAELGLPRKYWKLKQSYFDGNFWRARPRLSSVKTSGKGLTGLLGNLIRGFPVAGHWLNYMSPAGHLNGIEYSVEITPYDAKDMSGHINFALTPDGNRALGWLRHECEARGITVCYIYPKCCFRSALVDEANRHAEKLAREISNDVPVLNPSDSIVDDVDLFYDAPLHLNIEGARLFSLEIGQMLMIADMVPDNE